jgi:hypothetical protein
MPAAPGGVHAARSVRRGPSRDPSRYERLDRSSTQVASEDARIDGATHDKRALVAMDQPVPTLGRALTDRWRSYSRSANGASISFAASIPRSLARALRRRQTGHASRRQVASEDARIDGATRKRALAAMDRRWSNQSQRWVALSPMGGAHIRQSANGASRGDVARLHPSAQRHAQARTGPPPGCKPCRRSRAPARGVRIQHEPHGPQNTIADPNPQPLLRDSSSCRSDADRPRSRTPPPNSAPKAAPSPSRPDEQSEWPEPRV